MLRTVNLISGGGTTNYHVLREQEEGGKLSGLVKTVAIITNDFQAAGLIKATGIGFSKRHIHIVNTVIDLEAQLLSILGFYQPDFFHQLGWMPLTPQRVIQKYRGLNQHLGPGGRYMYGERRLWAHRRFCEIIGENRPVPIFCQLVEPKLDQGDVICVQFAEFPPSESIEDAAKRFLPIEHEIQVETLRKLALNIAPLSLVPRVYETLEEEKIMDQCRKEADEFYKKIEGKK